MASCCPVCIENIADSLHHIVPVAKGGDDSEKNKVSLCKRCHDIVEEIYNKTGMMYSPWLSSLIGKQQGFPISSPKDMVEYYREAKRRYYWGHREECLERTRKWRESDRGIEWQEAYYSEHKEELSERSKQKYREEHPKKGNELSIRRTAGYKALLTKLTRELWVPPRLTENEENQRFFSNLRKGLRQLQCVNVQKA